MSDTINVHIPEKHQSAPKEHPADKAIRQAAQEIHEGKWVDERPEDQLTIALGTDKRIAEGATEDDFSETENSLALSRHPRVLEALDRMRREVDESQTPQEYAEKSAMLFELNARENARQKWEGQERWEGAENEEMRYGLILTPFQFMERLQKVIGEKRVTLHSKGTSEGKPGREQMTGRVPVLVPDPMAIAVPGGKQFQTMGTAKALLIAQLQKEQRDYTYTQDLQKRLQSFERIKHLEQQIDAAAKSYKAGFPGYLMVATLQWPASTEWMIMRFNEYGVPTTPKFLGWRTALLAMIRAGTITEKEAEKAFPIPSTPAAEWYRQQLFEWRNHRVELVN